MDSSVGFGFSPQLTTKQHSPRRINSTLTSSPRTKRKRNNDDVDMDSGRTNTPEPSGKRTRSLPVGRPLPLSRLLEDLDKQGLQDLLKLLCEKHPGFLYEIYRHAPKPTVNQALATLAKLERQVQTSFPFGGDVRGEYAYNRVMPHIRELLNALTDYVTHFLPPNEEHGIETLNFLDGATRIIAQLPDWDNENHALTKREAFEEINGAWIQGFREANKKGAGIGATMYLPKLRHWNAVSNGCLETALQAANEELAWLADIKSHLFDAPRIARAHPQQGLFSQ